MFGLATFSLNDNCIRTVRDLSLHSIGFARDKPRMEDLLSDGLLVFFVIEASSRNSPTFVTSECLNTLIYPANYFVVSYYRVNRFSVYHYGDYKAPCLLETSFSSSHLPHEVISNRK